MKERCSIPVTGILILVAILVFLAATNILSSSRNDKPQDLHLSQADMDSAKPVGSGVITYEDGSSISYTHKQLDVGRRTYYVWGPLGSMMDKPVCQLTLHIWDLTGASGETGQISCCQYENVDDTSPGIGSVYYEGDWPGDEGSGQMAQAFYDALYNGASQVSDWQREVL